VPIYFKEDSSEVINRLCFWNKMTTLSCRQWNAHSKSQHCKQIIIISITTFGLMEN